MYFTIHFGILDPDSSSSYSLIIFSPFRLSSNDLKPPSAATYLGNTETNSLQKSSSNSKGTISCFYSIASHASLTALIIQFGGIHCLNYFM